MKRLYFRCNGGHYFRSCAACPFDGWSNEYLDVAERMFEEISQEPSGPSIEALRQRGLDQAVLDRVMIIEFGNEDFAFEALARASARAIHTSRTRASFPRG